MPVDSMAQSTFLLRRSKRWAEFIHAHTSSLVMLHYEPDYFFKLKNIKSMKIFLVVLLYSIMQLDFDGYS